MSGYGGNSSNGSTYMTGGGGGDNYNEAILQRDTPWTSVGSSNLHPGATGNERQVSNGMFGSLAWSGIGTGTGAGTGGSMRGRRKGGNELLGSLGMGSRRSPKVVKINNENMIGLYNDDDNTKTKRERERERGARDGGGGGGLGAVTHTGNLNTAESAREQECIAQAEAGLVGGLKPFRDRYLAGALSRMTAPVLLMFPEMDGYTGILIAMPCYALLLILALPYNGTK